MRYTASIDGMDCANCSAKIERAVAELDEVAQVSVDLMSATLTADIRDASARQSVERTVRGLGYGVVSSDEDAQASAGVDLRLMTVIASGVLIGVALTLAHGVGRPGWAIPVYLLATAVGGVTVFRGAWGSLKRLELDIDVLMTLAVIGALILGDWLEASTVVALFAFAEWLEGASMGRARRAIGRLVELAPQQARVRRDGDEQTVAVDEVGVGELVVVRPGERIPVDGAVVDGRSEVDQSPITGESRPVTKAVGDEVFAGTLNQRGSLDVRVERAPQDSTLARVIEAVRDAQKNRSKTEQLVERFARYYTPAVVVLAVLLAAVPPLALGASFAVWFYRALVLLVIACPCALVLATPITTASGIARAARDGILVKGGRFLEELGRAKAVAFDKTGTLTRGKLGISRLVAADGVDEGELLRAAALAESRSEHYVARAIVSEALARGGDVDASAVDGFQAHVGRGVEARLDDELILVGSRALLDEHGVDYGAQLEEWQALEGRGQTVVGVARAGRMLGLVALQDSPREQARPTIETLRALGIDSIYMLTGDNAANARSIGEELSLVDDQVLAELLPDQKVEAIADLQKRHDHVVMVGDGINDAPALASAPVGIAMGAAGTDIALDTAHVALMADDLSKLPEAIRLGRRTERIIVQNIVIALGIKAAVFGLAAVGMATLWMAVLADMGTSLLVIGNGLRMLRGR